MNCPQQDHPGKFEDAIRILQVAQDTHGLPFPSVCSTSAAFNFTHIVHAQDACESVILAETILCHALKTEFAPRDVPRTGSSAHYILSAYLPSGLRLDLVARAGIFADEDARKALAA